MIKGFSVTQVLGASGVTLSPSDVWNDAGVTFTGIKFNVTDTASNAASLLMDLQVGGVSRYTFSKDSANIGIKNGPFSNFNIGTQTNGYALLLNGAALAYSSHLRIPDSGYLSFGTADSARLYYDAVNTLAQRNGTNAQTKRIYGTYTDASNYRRVAIAMTTGGVASIAPEGAGTGASGNVLHISGLPTANPGPGILWNNGGTVEVGT